MERFFLFLQGPVGPFFRTLGRLLIHERQRVARVNFNGGDIYDWSGPEAIILRERAAEWPAVLSGLIKKYGITDLLTFGDCRPQLRRATLIAKSEGVRCHVFEEGYLRPDWITMEESGVNGNSSLPKEPEWYDEQAAKIRDEAEARPTGDPIRMLAYHTIAYQAAKFSAQPFFPYFRNHRPHSEWEHVRRWARKTMGMRGQSRLDRRFQSQFLPAHGRFFLFCLQLGSDYQIRRHSPFDSMYSAIESVLTSFSLHAPAGTNLLVKSHPLEIWSSELESFTLRMAEEFGISGRVFFTHGGDLNAYLEAARGMIAVNSTSGMASLELNRPTIALGKAIYDIAGLTHPFGLKSFWSDPVPPDRRFYLAFRKVLINKTQANGSFYTGKGIRLAIPTIMKRLLGKEKWEPPQRCAFGSGNGRPFAI